MFTVSRCGYYPAQLHSWFAFSCQQLTVKAFPVLPTKAKEMKVKQMSCVCLLTGSNCSSSSEGETTPTALHAGICVRQQCVSTKDTIIAREALSLLVTCLQLRCQQLSKTPAGIKCTTSTHTHIAIGPLCSGMILQYVHFISTSTMTLNPVVGFSRQVLFTTFPPSMISSLMSC